MGDPRIYRALSPRLPPTQEEAEHEGREFTKREIARQVLPFFKEIAIEARDLKVAYDRERVELIIEACRDYLMQEAEGDPDLSFDEKMGVAEMVTGIAKGWTLARDLMDKGALDYILPLYMVVVEHATVISDAIDLRKVGGGRLDQDQILALLARKLPLALPAPEGAHGDPPGPPT